MSKSSASKTTKFSITYLKDSDHICQIDNCAFMAQVFLFGVIRAFYLCKSHLADVLSDYETFEMVEEDETFEAWANWRVKKLQEERDNY